MTSPTNPVANPQPANAVQLHRAAMARADDADAARRAGDESKMASLFAEALELELRAIGLVHEEPSRSVLLRSAATLALEAGRIRDAERLIATALIGEPPGEVAEELRDLWEQVYFNRHLELRGVVLGNDEFQMSIAGEAVGYGMARSERLVRRIEDTQKLIYRTAERKLKQPFRESAVPAKPVRDEVEVYMSVPRAASLAVTFRLARPHGGQQAIAPALRPKEIIGDMLECLALVNDGRESDLRQRIVKEKVDEAYFRNFVAIARQIAPDGIAVKQVGFTRGVDGKRPEQRLAFNRPAKLIAIPVDEQQSSERLTFRGQLLFADDRAKAGKRRQSSIVIVEQNDEHTVLVPPGMMADVVKPLWGLVVEANCSAGKPRQPPVLMNIRRASED